MGKDSFTLSRVVSFTWRQFITAIYHKFKIPAQHWRVTYKPTTNKQRRSPAGEGEEEAGGKETSDPSPARKYRPRRATASRAVPPTSAHRTDSYDYFHSARKKKKKEGEIGCCQLDHRKLCIEISVFFHSPGTTVPSTWQQTVNHPSQKKNYFTQHSFLTLKMKATGPESFPIKTIRSLKKKKKIWAL